MKKRVVVDFSSVQFDTTSVQLGKYQYQILALELKRSDFLSAIRNPGDLVECDAVVAVSWRLNSLALHESVQEEAHIQLIWADHLWGPRRWQITGSAEFINELLEEGVEPIASPEEVREQPASGRRAPAAKKPPKRS